MKIVNKSTGIKKVIGLFLLLLISLGTAACTKPEDTAAKQPEVVSDTVAAYGVVKSKNVLDLVLEFPASVDKILVSEGQKVKKNEAIATLNLDDFKLQINAKDIELKISGKEKSKILSETSLGLSGDYDYLKLKDSLKLAQSSFDQADKDFKNAKALLASGAITQSEYDRYRIGYEQALNTKSNLEKDVAQYVKGKQGVVSSVGISDLQATATNLTLENMKSKLSADYMSGNQIVSPFSNAVVYDIGYEDGALAGSSKKFCSLADLDALIVEADVTEDFIAEVKLGAAVTVVPVADRSKTYHGKVTRIADMAKVDNGETLITVEITIEDNDGFLKPNYNVDLSISKM